MKYSPIQPTEPQVLIFAESLVLRLRLMSGGVPPTVGGSGSSGSSGSGGGGSS